MKKKRASELHKLNAENTKVIRKQSYPRTQ